MARMRKYDNVYELIATEFKKAEIAFVLIGGYAVNAYHFTRVTKDMPFVKTQNRGR